MDYFFYGTLRDPDVLSLVLGRRVAPARVKPARLAGYRCFYAKGASFPVIVPGTPGDTVEGCVVQAVDAHEARRLRRYEGAQYSEATVSVTVEGQGTLAARVFVPRAGLVPTAEPWRLDAWQRRHKRDYLRRVRSWTPVTSRA